MNKPTKEQYTQYWIYSKGQLIAQGVGTIPDKYKNHVIETEFHSEEYKSALANYNLTIKELTTELIKVGLDPKLTLDYGINILEADTPQKVALFIKQSLSPFNQIKDVLRDFKLEDLWNEK